MLVGQTQDSVNYQSDDALRMEQGYHKRETNKLQFKTVDRKKVETPHNYYPNTDEEKVVRIPGATHLCVTFDERCCLVSSFVAPLKGRHITNENCVCRKKIGTSFNCIDDLAKGRPYSLPLLVRQMPGHESR